jgi:hypothetical protein
VEETGLLSHNPKLGTGIVAEVLQSSLYNIGPSFPQKAAKYVSDVFCKANVVDANWNG